MSSENSFLIRVGGGCGILGPVVALSLVLLAVASSPWFTWEGNALSDLGHYFRVDIGPNPLIRAIIFNAGLIITGLIMMYFTLLFMKNTKDIPTKIGLLPFVAAIIFLIAIGVFSENFPPIHFNVSVGFFFSFPWAMWFVGLNWLRFPSLRWFSLISILLPFISIYLWMLPWDGVAIPELLTAFTAIAWVWIVNYLDYNGKLSDIY